MSDQADDMFALLEKVSDPFWSKVEKTETCWNWLGYIAPNGYGMIHRHSYVHRYSYEMHVGPVPDGMVIDHLCRNRACVNPEHLEPVSNKENILRGESPMADKARQTYCERGHELVSFVIPSRPDGRRYCPTCRAETNRKARDRAKLPYSWCIGNPTRQDCIDAGYCRRDPNCGE